MCFSKIACGSGSGMLGRQRARFGGGEIPQRLDQKRGTCLSGCRMQKLTFASPHVHTAFSSRFFLRAGFGCKCRVSAVLSVLVTKQMQKIENTDRQAGTFASPAPFLQVWRQKFNYLFRKMQAIWKQSGKGMGKT